MGWIALQAIAAVTCAVSLAVSGPVVAQDQSAYHKGLEAFEAGNFSVALEQFRLAAELGDADAQFSLGLMHANALGVPANDAEAAKWYRLSAAQGNARSQVNIAVMYERGKGVSRDIVASKRWYQLAADQHDPTAYLGLGVLYDRADAREEAMKWYEMAASHGLAEAMHNIALMYASHRAPDFGGGATATTEDMAVAIHWFELAASHGLPQAQFNLGSIYDDGRGVPEDDREAAKWYRLAAEQGYATAQLNLGALYANGSGVPEDYVQAYRWMNLAAAQGNSVARLNKIKLQKLMTPQQIAEAQRLATETVR